MLKLHGATEYPPRFSDKPKALSSRASLKLKTESEPNEPLPTPVHFEINSNKPIIIFTEIDNLLRGVVIYFAKALFSKPSLPG